LFASLNPSSRAKSAENQASPSRMQLLSLHRDRDFISFVPRKKFYSVFVEFVAMTFACRGCELRSEREQFGGRGGTGGEYRDSRKPMKKRLTKSAAAIAVYRGTPTRDRKNCGCIFGLNRIHLLGSCSRARQQAETHAIVHARIVSVQLASISAKQRSRRTNVNRQTFFRLAFSRSKIFFILGTRVRTSFERFRIFLSYFSRNILVILFYDIQREREREREREGARDSLVSLVN